MEQVYTPTKDYKVLVRCFTYNQSKYIEDALNGFAMQKTDFPFVCLVMDDASTDGEQEVIKAWMVRECDMDRAENVEIEKSFITIVPHKMNESCTFAFYFLKENLYMTGGKTPLITPWRECCEYEAMCEGDDYWIDINKLKSQTKVLDGNKDFVMCYTRAREYYQNSSCFGQYIGVECKNFKEFVAKDCIVTLTVLFRTNAYAEYEKNIEIQKCWLMGDLPLWAYFYLVGKVYYNEEITGIYRVMDKSSSHPDSLSGEIAFIHSSASIRKYFIEYGCKTELLSIWKKNYFQRIVATYHKYKQPVRLIDIKPYLCLDLKAIIHFLICLRYRFMLIK